MEISGGNTGGIGPGAVRDALGAGSGRLDQEHPKAAEGSGDARAARLLQIRQRILHGAYETDAVVAEVARRIIDRGDLRSTPGADA